VCSFSGSFGYNVNAVKCWLVVKEGYLQRANHVFAGTGVQVTSTGRPYLGAALGSTTFTNLFTQQRVSEWIEGVSRLSTFAGTQPHASYAAFTHGYLPKWKGSSSWLSALPLEQYGFALHKGEFIYAICLRYGYLPSRLPSHCLCGKDFSLSHALSCPHGAFPIIRHNEIRNLTANLMSEVTHNVQLGPQLHPLSGESLRYRSAIQDDDPRVDIRASGFWRCLHHHTFRVFNCFAASNSSSTLATVFRKHELEKRRAYEECIQEVEHGSFTPLSFLPQVAWERLLPPLTNTLLACSVSSGVPHILW